MKIVKKVVTKVEHVLTQPCFSPFLTLYLNFRLCKFKDAIKFPLWVYGRVAIECLDGKFEFPNGCHRKMVSIGRTNGRFFAPPPIRLAKQIAKRIININNKRKYYSFSNSARVKKGVEVVGAKYISLGDNVSIMNNSFLQVVGKTTDQRPILSIAEGTLIGRNSQICALNSITIGKNCIFAANCFISDTTHSYDDIEEPVISSPLKTLSSVVIGDGSWLGRNSSVVGCKIGKHCVVGNCAFVTKDIPDYCVVVGNPCKIIKRFNLETQQWEKTDKDGNFLNN